MCAPSARPAYAFGAAQASQSAASSLHSNEAPGSLAVNANDAAVESTVPLGPVVIDVSGGAVSIVHVRVAGVGSTFCAPSLARTENVWEPLPSPE